MPTRNTKFYSVLLIIGDFLVLLGAFSAAYVARVQLDDRPLVADVFAVDYMVTVLSLLPIWIIIFAYLGLYSANIYNRRLMEWSRILVGSFVGILLLIGWEFVAEEALFPARLVVVYAFIGSFLLVLFERELLRFMRSQLYRFGRGISRVLIIGNSPATRDIAEALADTPRTGYQIVAMAGPKRYAPIESGIKHFSSLETALKSIEPMRITTIIQTDLYDSEDRNQHILAAAQTRHIQYNFIPGEPEFYTGKNTVDIFYGYPLITVHQTPLVGWGEIVKRIFDLSAVILTFPIWGLISLVIAILQKLFNPGPIFYPAKRLTRGAKPFDMLKFRSMRDRPTAHLDAVEEFRAMGRADLADEYEKQRKITSEPDPRITTFGRFLRKTSLDELPQLFNVLRGDLSLIGPRPIEPIELPRYRGRGALLLSVQSGITGLWQVSGRNNLTFDQRVELELYYAQNWSFWLDMKILMKTPGALLRRRGVPDVDDSTKTT